MVTQMNIMDKRGIIHMTKINIPNRLTIIRILLVPVVVAVYLCMDPTLCVIDETSGLALRDVIAFVIFAVASITDFFDGMLARKNNWITSFGKFADPIADKMLVNTVLILMVYFHQANVIAVLLMIARDLIVDGLRMSAANSGEAKNCTTNVCACVLIVERLAICLYGYLYGSNFVVGSNSGFFI